MRQVITNAFNVVTGCQVWRFSKAASAIRVPAALIKRSLTKCLTKLPMI